MSRPQKFQKKPLTIEAMQWTGENAADIEEWCGPDIFETIDPEDRPGSDDPDATAGLRVAANGNTWLPILTNSWIARDASGFYPINPDRFAESYVPVPDSLVEDYLDWCQQDREYWKDQNRYGDQRPIYSGEKYLSNLRAQEKIATPRPWFQDSIDSVYYPDQATDLFSEPELSETSCDIATFHKATDAKFIADVRNAAPDLLDRIEQLESEVALMKNVVDLASMFVAFSDFRTRKELTESIDNYRNELSRRARRFPAD